MSRSYRTHVNGEKSPDTIEDKDGAPQELREPLPKDMVRERFSNKLLTLMDGRGWIQSELARRSGLPRDAISTYVNAKSLPSPHNLKLLAKALRTTPEDLLPKYVEEAIHKDLPSVEVRASVNAPDKAWLRVNRLVRLSTAVEVMRILQSDDVAAD